MEAGRGTQQPKLSTDSSTDGKPHQQLSRVRASAGAGAKILTTGARATARVKATAATEAEKTTLQGQLLRRNSVRWFHGYRQTTRRDTRAGMPLVAAPSRKPLATMGVPSTVVLTPKREVQAFQVQGAVTSSAALAPTRKIGGSVPGGGTRFTLQAHRSVVSSSTNGHQRTSCSLQQEPFVLSGVESQAEGKKRVGINAGRSTRPRVSASRNSVSGAGAVHRRPHRGSQADGTSCLQPWCGNTSPSESQKHMTSAYFTAERPTRQDLSSAIPLPSSSLVRPSTYVSCAGMTWTARSSGLPAASCPDLCEASGTSGSSFPRSELFSLEHPRSRKVFSAAISSFAPPTENASWRLPADAKQGLRKKIAIKASKETAGILRTPTKKPVDLDSNGTSLRNSRVIKHTFDKADSLRETVPVVPPLTHVREQCAPEPANCTSGVSTPCRSDAHEGMAHPTIRTNKQVWEGAPGAPASITTCTPDHVCSAREALFSTNAVYCASAALSSSSLSSDHSSNPPSSPPPDLGKPRDAFPLRRNAAAFGASPLRPILRLPPAVSVSGATGTALRERRPRRNARFALFGVAAAPHDLTAPTESPRARYIRYADTGANAATASDSEDTTLETAPAASYANDETEHAMTRLAVGERFPARWWRATRKRVANTRALLQRWRIHTLAKWVDEQKQEIDVFSSSVAAIGSRVHEVLSREFQELIRPEWVISTADSIVQRMLHTRKEAEERASRMGKKKVESGLPFWGGPSASSVFGDQLLMVSETPYTIIGVYARRTWAASLPVPVAERIFHAAEHERQHWAGPGRQQRTKADEIRRRFLLGTKDVLSSRRPSGTHKDTSARRAPISRWPSRWSLPTSKLTMEHEKTKMPSAGPRAATVSPGASAAAFKALPASRRATVSGGEQRWAPPHVRRRASPADGDIVEAGKPVCACRDKLAVEVASCLGVQRGRCAFPVEALKPHPPQGYGRAPVEAEDRRIFSELEDFLLVNQVPIKRPPWDSRRTPLMSTFRGPLTPTDENESPKEKKAEGDLFQDSLATVAATAQPKVEERLEPDEEDTIQQGRRQLKSSLRFLGDQESCIVVPSIGGSLSLATPRSDSVSMSELLIEEKLPTLFSHGDQEQGSGTVGTYGVAAPGSLRRLLSQHGQRSTAPIAASDLTAKTCRRDGRILGATMLTHSPTGSLEATAGNSSPLKKSQQQAPATRTSEDQGNAGICWKAKTLCERLKREAGNILLRQEDVKVSEFWKLRFDDDGTSVWCYEGLQCEPIGVSTSCLTQSAAIWAAQGNIFLIPLTEKPFRVEPSLQGKRFSETICCPKRQRCQG